MTLRQIAQRIRVPAGFVLLPLLLIAARPRPVWLLTGACFAAIGLAIRAWASGYVKKNRELTISGPYAHTRNPLYLGTFLMAAGVALSTGSLWFVLVFVAFYLLIYVPVMLAEAETLGSLFPSEYATYQREVPLFFPRFSAYRPTSSSDQPVKSVARPTAQFDKESYLRHREYRATIGVLVVYALMAVKFILVAQ